jgi:hypothetical protein
LQKIFFLNKDNAQIKLETSKLSESLLTIDNLVILSFAENNRRVWELLFVHNRKTLLSIDFEKSFLNNFFGTLKSN